jgi:hypothetical protein
MPVVMHLPEKRAARTLDRFRVFAPQGWLMDRKTPGLGLFSFREDSQAVAVVSAYVVVIIAPPV